MLNIKTCNKIETVCFTGHRCILKKDALIIPTKLKNCLKSLIERGAHRFRAGGATGFDTIAALCVLELKETYPDIFLDLKLPCKNQTQNWKEDEKMIYNYILSKADTVEYITETYTSWCMHERNRRLVNGSQVCIAYLTESRGGTAFTYNYALTKELEVINIAE